MIKLKPCKEIPYIECEHKWVDVDSMYSNERFTDVICSKCAMSGERDEIDGTVFWPAT